MTGEPLDDLSVRLERERRAADDAYNAALTALDGALHPGAVRLPPPPRFDRSRLAELSAQKFLPAALSEGARDGIRGRVRALIWRAMQPALERQQAFNAAVIDELNRQAAVWDEWTEDARRARDAVQDAFGALDRFQSLLVQYLQTITAFVDTKDRALVGTDLRDRLSAVEQRVAALKRRVEEVAVTRVAAATGAAGIGAADRAATRTAASTAVSPPSQAVFGDDVDSLTYVGFEDKFRGSTDEIRGRVEEYLPVFEGATNVVDVGCGRGELLALLKARGIPARGVDTNRGMVELCREQGLQVEQGDALTFLRGQPDDSLGGLIAVQVVEHFEPAYLTKFIDTAYLKLRPGAALVLETLNPACWMAFFETYIRDLTHQRPLHPDTLSFLVRSAGFVAVDVRFRQPARAEDRLDRVPAGSAGEDSARVAALVAAVNAHADKLNARLFSSMDYAVVARR